MLLLIRPKHFGFNPQTADSNAFQSGSANQKVHLKAIDEFNRMTQVLSIHGIQHIILDDTDQPIKPDSVFPNNWFSTHPKKKLVIYPLLAENRRSEKREDIIQYLMDECDYSQVIDLSHYERENKFLEGTGSLVLDRENNVAFMARSPRSNFEVAQEICYQLSLSLIDFTAIDSKGVPVYHTNVMMTLGENFLLWCPEVIHDESDTKRIREYIEETGKESIEFTESQMHSFVGNMFEVRNNSGSNCLLLSSTARRALTTNQIFALRNHASLLPIPIPTIEQFGGGSIRCMVAKLV